ncbi:Uncharacterised protein [Mycobacteroides abscessus subsp. abscessus]|nr:Uncharacterised protein [Mycobacteroides abscessus subsp. abscessus]
MGPASISFCAAAAGGLSRMKAATRSLSPDSRAESSPKNISGVGAMNTGAAAMAVRHCSPPGSENSRASACPEPVSGWCGFWPPTENRPDTGYTPAVNTEADEISAPAPLLSKRPDTARALA